jgi:hypothetical protein
VAARNIRDRKTEVLFGGRGKFNLKKLILKVKSGHEIVGGDEMLGDGKLIKLGWRMYNKFIDMTGEIYARAILSRISDSIMLNRYHERVATIRPM